MTFLAPLSLALGAAVAAAVLALHLITTRRPPAAPLPTARFVPVTEARAVSRASRPVDLLLLALRVLAVLLISAAFARPVLDAPGARVRSVVLLDVSASVADPAAARALAGERLTAGGALVLFDTAAREVPADSTGALLSAASPAESSAEGAARVARGALSPALVAGLRAAARVARGADSVRLVLVSPVTEDALDAATRAIRAGWPGGIEVVRPVAAADTAPPVAPVLVSSLADDPLAPAIARRGAVAGGHAVRIVRDVPSAADSAWSARAGHVLVHWPLVGAEELAPDAVLSGGVRAVALVAPLARLPLPQAGRVIARWRDGAPAATQVAVGAGCVRRIGVGVPVAGDVTLRPPFARFLAFVAEPCTGRVAPVVPDSALAWLRGTGDAVAARPFAAGAPTDSPLAAWLLGAALLLLLGEWIARRGRNG